MPHIFPKTLILEWSISRFFLVLFSSWEISHHKIPRFLVSHEKMTCLIRIQYYFIPEGDICSAFARISIVYSKLHIFKKPWTAKIFELSWTKTCSTSNGWNNLTSPGQGSFAIYKDQKINIDFIWNISVKCVELTSNFKLKGFRQENIWRCHFC